MVFLYYTSSYIICQNLTLTPGILHTYSFDIGIHYGVNVSTVYVYLNNNLIGVH